MIFVSQAGRSGHEHICESLEFFTKDVVPEFEERETDPEAVIRAAMKA
jgi:hypothetical protein